MSTPNPITSRDAAMAPCLLIGRQRRGAREFLRWAASRIMRHHFAIVCLLLIALCCSCQHAAQRAGQSSAEKISIAIDGWVQRPGFYQLESGATLATATRACGGWSARSDVERLRSVRLVRRFAGQTNELIFRVREVAPETIQLRDADELSYRAVLW